MNKVSVLVAIYKNEYNIFPFYEEFNQNIAPYFDDYELIMINDDSPDRSWEIMCSLAERDDRVKCIRLSRNFGAIPTIFTGIQYATGDCVMVKACDLQEPSDLSVNMYNEWKNGEKMVFAVREARKDSVFGDLFSNLYYFFMRKMVDPKMPKGGFDIYLMDRTIAQKIVEMNDKNSPIVLQLMWLGYHPKKLYYVRKKREIGKSSWSLAKKVKLFVDSLIAFSYIPIRIMSLLGVLFLVFSVVYGICVLIARLRGLIPIQGYTTLLIIVLFSAGLIMFTLGILGEYIWRTLESSRNRPLSVVRDTVNFDK